MKQLYMYIFIKSIVVFKTTYYTFERTCIDTLKLIPNSPALLLRHLDKRLVSLSEVKMVQEIR